MTPDNQTYAQAPSLSNEELDRVIKARAEARAQGARAMRARVLALIDARRIGAPRYTRVGRALDELRDQVEALNGEDTAKLVARVCDR